MKGYVRFFGVFIFSTFILLTWILLLFYWIDKKNEIVGKYLIQTSVREFYDDIIKTELDGGLECVWNG